jgi:hypothetical protein
MKATRCFPHDPERIAVVIRRDLRNGIGETLDYLFETQVLHKRSRYGYFNSTAGNRRIWPALLIAIEIYVCTGAVATFALLSLLPIKNLIALNYSIELEQILAGALVFVGTWLGLFWQEKRHLYSKWQYLAGLYNTVIQAGHSGEKLYCTRDVARVALSVDILELEMWAHKSFREEFRSTLADAIEKAHLAEPHVAEALNSKLTTNGIRKKVAAEYLASYQSDIFEYLDDQN